jgi:hypothetical protein
MGFYNMSTGDAPYFKALADNFAISDNYCRATIKIRIRDNQDQKVFSAFRWLAGVARQPPEG